jgi:hypothetical protein
MGKENPVLVLASRDDPQFAMLNKLPHTVCGDVAACADAGKRTCPVGSQGLDIKMYHYLYFSNLFGAIDET